MSDKTVRDAFELFLATYPQYFLSNIDSWKNTLKCVTNYIDLNKKMPSEEDKNSKTKHLGKWVQHQKSNYKKVRQSMKIKEIYDIWTQFLIDYY